MKTLIQRHERLQVEWHKWFEAKMVAMDTGNKLILEAVSEREFKVFKELCEVEESIKELRRIYKEVS